VKKELNEQEKLNGYFQLVLDEGSVSAKLKAVNKAHKAFYSAIAELERALGAFVKIEVRQEQ
jgi:uncharacterized protein YdbL (DUF1318 family)